MQIWVHIKLKCKFLACKEACQESFRKKAWRDKKYMSYIVIVNPVNVIIELRDLAKCNEYWKAKWVYLIKSENSFLILMSIEWICVILI